ncbi:hypothetical protein EVAR_79468_1 [Eumeta japonica]|uniref:Uncharacterized protein n=1 Tax=Eumeta variegata TaxID=151549 RepID=A0A4C1UEK6_EUMVA|nr:hypothetical protein EVAR_79468_1 [Eumeta japonica]
MAVSVVDVFRPCAVQRTELCRCEVSHESFATAQDRNAGEKKEGPGSVEPAHCIIRCQSRAPECRSRLEGDGRSAVMGVEVDHRNTTAEVTILRLYGVRVCYHPSAHFRSTAVKVHCTT